VDGVIAIIIVLGALLALPYCAHARSGRRPRLNFAVGLVVASLIYVVFALMADEGQSALIEAGGVAAFAILVAAGLRGSIYWLATGWIAHVAWDLALHPVDDTGYAPWWYPVLCIGFDLLVAGFIVAAGLRQGRHRP
jgi:hypothetical protein